MGTEIHLFATPEPACTYLRLQLAPGPAGSLSTQGPEERTKSWPLAHAVCPEHIPTAFLAVLSARRMCFTHMLCIVSWFTLGPVADPARRPRPLAAQRGRGPAGHRSFLSFLSPFSCVHPLVLVHLPRSFLLSVK